MQDQEEVLQIVTERATLEKRDQVTGRVRVNTETETVEQLVSASLERSDVKVTRVPIGRQVDVAPPVRTEGDVTIVPVLEEILVVEKRLVLREEIHLRQVTQLESVELPIELRKQHAVIEREVVPTTTVEQEPTK